MDRLNPEMDEDAGHRRRFVLQFTPAEWRVVLEDRSFLAEEDNRFCPPRRLMGVEVEIVPDHALVWSHPRG
ncbi:hypothetical protein BH11PSE2_BH11PSE2_19800 [soil metagenome]